MISSKDVQFTYSALVLNDALYGSVLKGLREHFLLDAENYIQNKQIISDNWIITITALYESNNLLYYSVRDDSTGYLIDLYLDELEIKNMRFT